MRPIAPILYPRKAKLNKVLRKSKIYENSNVGRRHQQYFIDEVEKIVWEYKLSSETTNLFAKLNIFEIQIFSIHMKIEKFHIEILKCIDMAIPSPIFFEISFQEKIRMMAAYKCLYENRKNGKRNITISSYFDTKWLDKSISRVPMPTAFDLDSLYEELLYQLIPLERRQRESISALVSRAENVDSRERTIAKLSQKLQREKQFNKKISINEQLRLLRSEVDYLKSFQ